MRSSGGGTEGGSTGPWAISTPWVYTNDGQTRGLEAPINEMPHTTLKRSHLDHVPLSSALIQHISCTLVRCAESVHPEVIRLDVIGSPSRKKKPDVGFRVYTEAADAASGSLSSGPTPQILLRCLPTVGLPLSSVCEPPPSGRRSCCQACNGNAAQRPLLRSRVKVLSIRPPLAMMTQLMVRWSQMTTIQ